MAFPEASSFETGRLKNTMLQTERVFVLKTYMSMLETCANVECNYVGQLKKFLEQWNEKSLFFFFFFFHGFVLQISGFSHV